MGDVCFSYYRKGRTSRREISTRSLPVRRILPEFFTVAQHSARRHSNTLISDINVRLTSNLGAIWRVLVRSANINIIFRRNWPLSIKILLFARAGRGGRRDTPNYVTRVANGRRALRRSDDDEAMNAKNYVHVGGIS